jgi:2-oxoglutarate ferredoxin oxidoreductase subunit gamma
VLVQEERPEFVERVRAPAGRARPPRRARPTAPDPSVLGDSAGPAAAGERRVRLAGAGGQGIVLAGLLLAEAAVAAGKNATHAQAYGPESRGGASRAEVIISDGDIDYPCAEQVDCLVALSQEAFDRYRDQLEPGGLLIIDGDRVSAGAAMHDAYRALPITRTTLSALGSLVGANLVALGALLGFTRLVPIEAMERVLAARPPGGSLERALRALRAGVDLAAR